MPVGPLSAVNPLIPILRNQSRMDQREQPGIEASTDQAGSVETEAASGPSAVTPAPEGDETDGRKSQEQTDEQKRKEREPGPVPASELTPTELDEIRNLKNRDREVRAHEQAHVAAGGAYVKGRPNYTYETGPDGHQYAVGGEVSIDTGSVPDNPEASIQKARTIKRAALAPAQPSAQDRQVAAKAARMEQEARVDMSRENMELAREAKKQEAEEAETRGRQESVYHDFTYGRGRPPPGSNRLSIGISKYV